MIDIGSDLDLYEDEAVEITKRAKDLASITLNETEFSREFSVPANNKNNQVFGFYANIDVDSVINPHKSIDAMWTFDLNVRFIGVLEIKGCTYKNGLPHNYTLVFYGRSKNLASIFGEDKLTDVDWSAYNHTLNYLNVLNSWQGLLLSGDIMYPLIDYYRNFFFGDPDQNIEGNIRNEANGILLNDLKPAIKLRAFLKTIFTNYGLTLSGTIDDSEFDTVFVQPNNQSGSLVSFSEFDDNAVLVDNSSSFTVLTGGAEKVAELDNEIQDINDNWNSTTYTFTAPVTGSYSFNKVFSVNSAPAILNIDSFITLNGSPQNSATITGGLITSAEVSRNITFSLTAGDEVKFAFSNAGTTTASISQCSVQTTDFPTVDEGTTQDLANTIPDDKITEFINQMLRALRWIIVPGTNEGEWDILSESAWRANATTRDWSQYIDLKNITYRKPTVYKNVRLTFQESESAVHTAFEEIANRRFGEVNIIPDVDFGEDKLEIESPFTLWPPSVYQVLNNEGETVDTINFDLYKMLDIEGSSTQDKYLLFHNNATYVASSYSYFLQSGVSSGDPIFIEQTLYPVCKFYKPASGTLPDNNDLSLCYAIEYPFSGEPPLETFYKEYWQEELYQLYAKGSRIATGIFYLPKSEFLAWELNDRIFCEGRYWVIDELTYNTGTEQAKAILRSDDPITFKATLDGVSSGGKANFTGDVDSFSATGNNMKKRGADYFLGTSKASIFNNKIRYTEAKTQIFNTYISEIIETIEENILTWGES